MTLKLDIITRPNAEQKWWGFQKYIEIIYWNMVSICELGIVRQQRIRYQEVNTSSLQ